MRRPSKKNSKKENKKFPYRKKRTKRDLTLKEEICLFIIFTIGLTFIFFGGVFLSDDIKFLYDSKTKSDVGYYRNCANLSLEKTAYCLRDYVSTFYNYDNDTEDEKFKGLDYIIKNGGDCSDYAQLYEKFGDSLGFHSRYVVIGMNDDFSHAISIISKNSEYCILDQTIEPYCVDLD